MLEQVSLSPYSKQNNDLRLAFEVFHDVQEPVVDIGLVVELDLNLVQICKSVLSGKDD